MLKQKLLGWGVLCTVSSVIWGAVFCDACCARESVSQSAASSALSSHSSVNMLLAQAQPDRTELSGKERKDRKNYTSKNKRSKSSSEHKDRNTQVDFIDSEDGYWNARGSNAPQFVDGGSINSVMFENRPGRRVKEIPAGPVRNSDVEVTGGKSTQITVNGRRVTLDKSKDIRKKK
ncbi:MAG: hypothetical protein ACI38Q_03830 [Candidatus Bruticola sp.]